MAARRTVTTVEAGISSFENFDPQGYISDHCSTPNGENTDLLRFHAEVHSTLPPSDRMLEFGGGPTIYQLISAARYTQEIHFSDYLPANLNTVEAWRTGERGSTDWSPFIQRALQLEGNPGPDETAILRREELIRSRLTRFLHADALASEPIGSNPASYDKVAANFVFEAITPSRAEWQKALLRVASLVRVGGHFVNTVAGDSSYWFIGHVRFPGLPISASDIREALSGSGFNIQELQTVASDTPDPSTPDYCGYRRIIMLVARRSR